MQVYMWIFDPVHPRTIIYGVLVGELKWKFNKNTELNSTKAGIFYVFARSQHL